MKEISAFLANFVSKQKNDTGAADKKKIEFQIAAKLQFDKAKDNIIKLRDSGNLIIIDNYIQKYPEYPKGTVKFENLKKILNEKQFCFNNNELEMIIRLRSSNIRYKEVKSRVLFNNPIDSDACLRNYLTLFYNNKNESMVYQVLKDTFNYNGDIAKDIARIKNEMEQEKNANALKKFESDLFTKAPEGRQISTSDIDKISGYDFELLLKRLFKEMGYQVTHTSFSKDQGADLILDKDGTRTVVQAKNWTANVGNTAIQEVVAAIKHYNSHRAMVISSSGFTQSAIDLARSNNVEMWDREKLSIILNDNPILKE